MQCPGGIADHIFPDGDQLNQAYQCGAAASQHRLIAECRRLRVFERGNRCSGCCSGLFIPPAFAGDRCLNFCTMLLAYPKDRQKSPAVLAAPKRHGFPASQKRCAPGAMSSTKKKAKTTSSRFRPHSVRSLGLAGSGAFVSATPTTRYRMAPRSLWVHLDYQILGGRTRRGRVPR